MSGDKHKTGLLDWLGPEAEPDPEAHPVAGEIVGGLLVAQAGS